MASWSTQTSSSTASISPEPVDTASASPTRSLAHYSGGEVNFDYPSPWTATYFEDVSSFSSVIVFLSTEQLSDPCTRTITSEFSRVECGSPLGDRQLGPNGLLVSWLGRGFPGWRFDPGAGAARTIGGRTASVDDHAAPDYCTANGGQREMIAIVPLPDAIYNWREMDACYRGPDLSLVRTQLTAMLDSVKWPATH